MKRFVSILVLLALMLAMLPVGASATPSYVPIYVGHLAADYLAEQILADLDLSGKSSYDKILTVYDWVIENGERYEWDGEYRFDDAQVQQACQGNFAEEYRRKLDNGQILLRREWETVSGLCGTDYFDFSLDTNYHVGNYAYQMMLKMTGNCAHFTSLLTVLLGHLGFDSRLFHGDFVNMDGTEVEHTWNYVLVDGTWYWMDVRIDHAIGAGSHQYFMVEDTELWAKEHIWPQEQSDWLKENEAEIWQLYSTPAVQPEPVQPVELICSDWAKDHMQSAYAANMIPAGMLETDLAEEITRQEFAEVAVRLYERFVGASVPDFGGESPFTDTADPNVLRAYNLGIVNGIGNGLFAPNDTLTREQASAMLGRVYELATQGLIFGGALLPQGAEPFADDDSILDYAKHYIYFFAGRGVLLGVGENTFAPKRNMTKEQALKISVVCLENMQFSDSAS